VHVYFEYVCFMFASSCKQGIIDREDNNPPPNSLQLRTACLHGNVAKCVFMGCLHDRANIEQLARRSMVISMQIKKAGWL